MKLYFIYACEKIFKGYNGMFYVDLVECSSLEDAQEIGAKMSLEVMDDFYTLENYIDDDMSTTDIEEIYNANVSYCIWKIDMDKINNLSLEELKEKVEKVHFNWEQFRDKYCYKESVNE